MHTLKEFDAYVKSKIDFAAMDKNINTVEENIEELKSNNCDQIIIDKYEEMLQTLKDRKQFYVNL